MNKDILRMITLAKRTADAYEKYGVVSFGTCGIKEVHMTEEAFLNYFPEHEIEDYCEEYIKLKCRVNDFEFFCLRRKRNE